jgi:deoxyribodipyrimidine photo-lyase
MIHPERIQNINRKPLRKEKRFFIYWMQAAQRAEWNHALEYALDKAAELNKPLVVFFGLTPDFPEAGRRAYRFMLEGLRETADTLRKRGIGIILQRGHPARNLVKTAKEAAGVVTDRGYLRIQREWRQYAAEKLDCVLYQVESGVVVPVETASGKEEYSAATIRKKIESRLNQFLKPLVSRTPKVKSLDWPCGDVSVEDIDKALDDMSLGPDEYDMEYFRGGAFEAKKHLQNFLNHKINRYHERSRDPAADGLSNLSPYLHFGQISPLYIAIKAGEETGPGKDAFMEELIVRRELSMNFVFYNSKYDQFQGLPEWARTTLDQHRRDSREYVYQFEDWNRAETHDPYWNAAQQEMLVTGKMHGYMRMYWGKKILEWSRTPEEAFRTALTLNNMYELDGRDPNGYTGVAWCFGKHDRGWPERKVYGKVRYMNANGLKRKFDADAYVDKIKKLVKKTQVQAG